MSADRWRKIREFLHGFYAYEFERQALEMHECRIGLGR